ncbi:hypothetical protein [Microbacterium stercoris]|uniref:Uncharacterized protein n=1 Tax=Microbacterium stercoris TaxID=2820289 RepID=A0A939TVW2_9MICO|nr:hypothetical protein [Microbacterium stercoris]MBO3662012.1 hypothetical protein [Microbacterium stercoris]
MKQRYTATSAFVFAGLWVLVALIGMSAQSLPFMVGGGVLAVAFAVLAVVLLARRSKPDTR